MEHLLSRKRSVLSCLLLTGAAGLAVEGEARADILVNSHFDAGLSGWNVESASSGGWTVTDVAAPVYTAPGGAQITHGPDGTWGTRLWQPLPGVVAAGDVYRISTWARSDSGISHFEILLENYDPGPFVQWHCTNMELTDQWTEVGCYFTMPSALVGRPARVVLRALDHGQTVYVDDVIVEPIAPPPELVNASFDEGLVGWTWFSSDTPVTAAVYDAGAAKITSNGTGFGSQLSQTLGSVVSAGSTYTVTVALRGLLGGEWAGVLIKDELDLSVNLPGSALQSLTTGAQLVSAVVTVPPSADGHPLRIELRSFDGTIYADDVALCAQDCVNLPNADGVCTPGGCAIVTCDPGFDDCDGDPSNGCEADLASAVDCGSCGNVCMSGVCAAGSCVPPVVPACNVPPVPSVVGATSLTLPSLWLDNGTMGYEEGRAQYADVNGDGLLDLIYQDESPLGPNSFYVSLATGSSFTAPDIWVVHGWPAHDPTPFVKGRAQYADVNADGMADLIFQGSGVTGDENEFYVSLSTGTGFTGPASWVTHGWPAYDPTPFVEGRAQYADVNGDCMADLIFQGSGVTGNENEFYVSLSTGTGFTGPASWVTHGWPAYDPTPFVAGRAQYADIDGDGMTDLVFQGSGVTGNENEFYVSLSTGTGFTGPASWVTHGWPAYDPTPFVAGRAQYADLDDDGMADLIFQGSGVTGNENEFYVSLSTGTGFTGPASWVTHGWPAYDPTPFVEGRAQYADLDADGMADLIFQGSGVTGDENEFYVSLSTGTGFTGPASWMMHGGRFARGQADYGDLDGDGRADLMFQGNIGDFHASFAQ